MNKFSQAFDSYVHAGYIINQHALKLANVEKNTKPHSLVVILFPYSSAFVRYMLRASGEEGFEEKQNAEYVIWTRSMCWCIFA